VGQVVRLVGEADQVPKLGSGKIDRTAVRALLSDANEVEETIGS
jgi:hypothetical protein